MNEQLAMNALRVLGVDMINKAKSGHPGIVLGAAPMAFTLFTKQLRIDNEHSEWFNRDRFILAAGHGSGLLYSLLHFMGYISMEDCKNFRQLNSLTPGHPEYGHTKGVDATSGPLGQGIPMGIGFAIAESFLAKKFNRPNLNVVDHYTYVLCGDGDLQEGITQEGMSLAGHLGTNKLIILYDSNDVQLDGNTSLANSENIKQKYEAMNWNYILVKDGNDINAINNAIEEAKKALKPSIIEIKTVIGYASPKAGLNKVHGSPIGEEGALTVRKNLGWENEPFDIPSEVYDYYKAVQLNGKKAYSDWIKILDEYKEQYSDLYGELVDIINDNVVKELSWPVYEEGFTDATRNIAGSLFDVIGSSMKTFMAGSADVMGSTMVHGLDGNYSSENKEGRNICFGVREHAMGAIINGITLHKGLRASSGAFFVFSDYMKPSMRMAALMQIPSIFSFSHDSIAVGEDGPTHEPIEQLIALRSIPGLNVMRPCDANETVFAYRKALESKNPSVVILTRQKVQTLANTSYDKFTKGAYVIHEAEGKMDGILIACGSEVKLAVDVASKLALENIFVRVVSMPSCYLFDQQDAIYKESILPKNSKRLAIEMGSSYSYYKYANNVYGIDTFGLSAPMDQVIKSFGFDVTSIVNYYKEIK